MINNNGLKKVMFETVQSKPNTLAVLSNIRIKQKHCYDNSDYTSIGNVYTAILKYGDKSQKNCSDSKTHKVKNH